MRPGVARKYIQEVIEGFEAYAKQTYVPALCNAGADAHQQVAGARFVATRDVDGMEGCLRELLGTRTPTRTKAELDEACVEALLRTSEDEDAANRFVAFVATDRRTSKTSARVLEQRLADMGAPGVDAILRELAVAHHDNARLRRLVRLLIRTTETPPPQRVSKWIDLPVDERRAVIDEWRRDLLAAGRLEGLEEAGEGDDEANEPAEDG